MLENGLVLFLLRDPEVPLVTVQALVRTGAVLEPAAKVDLAEITGRVMRTGGTARHTGQQLNVRLESLGASARDRHRPPVRHRVALGARPRPGGRDRTARGRAAHPGLRPRRGRAGQEAQDRGDPPGQRRAGRHRLPRVPHRGLRGRPARAPVHPRDGRRDHPGGSRRLSRALVLPGSHHARRQRLLRRGGAARPRAPAFRRLAARGCAGSRLPGPDAAAAGRRLPRRQGGAPGDAHHGASGAAEGFGRNSSPFPCSTTSSAGPGSPRGSRARSAPTAGSPTASAASTAATSATGSSAPTA